MAPDSAEIVVQATCILHNFLTGAVPGNFTNDDAGNAAGLQELPNMRGMHASTLAKHVQDVFASYFVSEAGEVRWQNEAAHI